MQNINKASKVSEFETYANNFTEEGISQKSNSLPNQIEKNNIKGEEDFKAPLENNSNSDKTEKETENHYYCHHLVGGSSHPGVIVETAGLANIKPPLPFTVRNYRLNLLRAAKSRKSSLSG